MIRKDAAIAKKRHRYQTIAEEAAAHENQGQYASDAPLIAGVQVVRQMCVRFPDHILPCPAMVVTSLGIRFYILIPGDRILAQCYANHTSCFIAPAKSLAPAEAALFFGIACANSGQYIFSKS